MTRRFRGPRPHSLAALGAVAVIAMVDEETYPRIVDVMKDLVCCPRSYEVWCQMREDRERTYERRGIVIRRQKIDVEEFLVWCAARGAAVDRWKLEEYAFEQAKPPATTEKVGVGPKKGR